MSWSAAGEVHSYLNDELGLPATDSAYLIDLSAQEEFAFFHGPAVEPGPHYEALIHHAREGRISALHSVNVCIGGYPAKCTRRQVATALERLANVGVRIPIWTNHGSTSEICNLGGNAPVYQEGDLPGSDAYVLDLLLSAGIRWYWMDHHTTNDFAQFCDGKGLVRKEITRAGFSIDTFVRFRGALPKAPDVDSFAWQLSDEHIQALITNRASAVIYQHWGCRRDAEGKPFTAVSPVLPEPTRAALSQLSRLNKQGTVEVLRVQDLLCKLTGV